MRYLQLSRSVLVLLAAATLCACVTQPTATAVKVPVFPAAPEEPRFYYERSIYASGSIVSNQGANLRRLITGETAASGDGLGKPYGVAAFQGKIYVSDSAMGHVAVFDIPRAKYSVVGDAGPQGKLTMPLGLDVDAKGNLYVVDGSSKSIQVYDRRGQYLRTLAGDKPWLEKPTGVAVDSAGSRVYIVDTAGVSSQNHQVRVFDAVSGEHLLDFGKRGSEPGEFNLPRDVTIGMDGNLYVVDGGNFRVQVFTPDGKFLRLFGAVGRRSGQFSRPKEAAVDANGYVYVVDAAFGNFQIFTQEGVLLLTVGDRSTTDGMAKYMLPSGIAVDADGRVYMVDQYFRKVDVYRPARLAANEGFTYKPVKQ